VACHYTFERSGGFAGARLTLEADAASLRADVVKELDELVEAADFFKLPATMRAARPMPDRYQYVVTVECGEARHTIRASEEAIPESLQPLLEYLTQLAIQRARG
jgi:2-polyprenyl-6-methoxyphenol hydroxylase-like FAD-dependent oxidoreductase